MAKAPIDPTAQQQPKTVRPTAQRPVGGDMAGDGTTSGKPAVTSANSRPPPTNGNTDNASNGVTTQTGDTQVAKGGIEGFFGGKYDVPQYVTQKVGDISAPHKERVDQQLAAAQNRGTIRMNGVNGATAAAVDQTAANATRDRQNALLDSLQGTVAGTAPSAANATLQQATDRNLAASLSQAAAAGNTPAAQRAAAFQRAQIQQDAAAQSAALRANEIATAQGQLASAAQGVRAQDLDVAGQNAQLSTQVDLANSAQRADIAKTNLLSSVEQQKQKDDQIAKLISMGYTMDQAAQAAEIQQRQYNAGLLTQQEAARQGVSAQNGASAAQTGVGLVSALASGAAALSDERQKKKIKDGDSVVEKYLDEYDAEPVTPKTKPGTTPGGVESDEKTPTKTSNPLVGRISRGSSISSDNGDAAQLSDETEKKNVKDGNNATKKLIGESTGTKVAGAVGQSLAGLASDYGRAASNSSAADRARSELSSMTDSVRRQSLSDERQKKNVKGGDSDVGAFLDSLEAKEYEYKHPDMEGAGHGRRVGIMAQDMEKTPMGKAAVVERDGKKMIDVNKSVSAALAGLANLNKRLKELENV